MHIRLLILALMVLGISACSRGEERDITLRSFQSSTEGPDEFAILPSKPLQEPENYSELPAPTPGQANLTDPTPRADAVAALGGRPERLVPGGVPASDGALVRHASRNGTDPNIRETLAAQDKEFRQKKSRFTKIRLFRTDRYSEVYERETLNPRRAWNRARQTGVRIPTAPPAN